MMSHVVGQILQSNEISSRILYAGMMDGGNDASAELEASIKYSFHFYHVIN